MKTTLIHHVVGSVRVLIRVSELVVHPRRCNLAVLGVSGVVLKPNVSK